MNFSKLWRGTRAYSTAGPPGPSGLRPRLLALSLSALLGLAACGGGGGDASPAPPSGGGDPGGGAGEPPVGFKTLSDAAWDDDAVRRVLNTFAYGGRASDAQIEAWAGMAPATAIAEMLTFDEHNLRLSPVALGDTDGLDRRPGTLRALSAFWLSDDPANGTRPDARDFHAFPLFVWYKAALAGGLNPFRQKIGLWETNYHMSVNQRVGVTNDQIFAYYDAIMEAHEAGLPYEQVIATAALSAAVARQYGYFGNRWIDGRCVCNEDFARELHQLFFGILGDYDPEYHETVAIKNTAAALTDIRLAFDETQMDFVDIVTFGTLFHAPGPLDILNATIAGVDAQAKIEALAEVAVVHPESLDNLPVKIIGDLADDNLTDEKIQVVREAWTGMNEKSLLEFLRAYAVSETFHAADRVKFRTSVDRHFLLANRVILDNADLYTELYTPYDIAAEAVQVFAPRHNVFGAQTGLEAATSSEVFRNNYNRVTAEFWRYVLPNLEEPDVVWEKDWAAAAPREPDGGFRVATLAEWLWQRFVGDGLASFGTLERAHVYALLATEFDLVYEVNRRELVAAGQDPANVGLYDFERVVTTEALETEPELVAMMDELGAARVALDSGDTQARRLANARMGLAVDFIAATPYIFAETGERP